MQNIHVFFICLLLVLTAATSSAQDTPEVMSNSASPLQNNPCFARLNDNDEVIVTTAFHSGTEGFKDLQQLIARKPWGEALTSAQRKEIAKLKKEASPFLVITLSKRQAMMLEDHRDLIKWILVQSTTTPCS